MAALLDGSVAPWLDRLAAAQGVAAKRFARSELERALVAADPGVLTEQEAARALALGMSREIVEAARRPRPPHAVGVPLVAEDGSVVVRLFEVAFEPVEGRVALDAEADAACREAIAAAAGRLAARPDARRYRFVPCSPSALARARIDGRSLGAACFVSALSLFSDRPVRAGTVVTGAIEGSAVISVGSAASKIAAARRAGARRVVAPSADAHDAEGVTAVATLDALDRACLETETAATDPDALVACAARAARDGWSGYRWRSVREATTRAIAIVPDGRPDLRVDALAQLAAASRHLGDLAGSGRAIELAIEVCESPRGREGVPDEALGHLERQRAMYERSRGRLVEATGAAKHAVAIARRARLRGDLLKALGVEGLVLMARGRDEAALAPLEEALAITIERTPAHAARSRAYLVEALGRVGRIEDARAHAAAALAECAADGLRGQPKEAWVRTSLGGAIAFAEAWGDVMATLDHPAVHDAIARDPLPGLLARRWLGLALHRLGDADRGSSVLAASGFAYGVALEPSLRFAADVNTLHDVAERARTGALDIADAREALARIAAFEAAARVLARGLARADRSLRSRARAAAALHALALDAGRLA